MPNISEIVNVTISRETAAVSRASFGVMMHLSLGRVFDTGETWREYTSAADLLTDGFKTTDTAYLAANIMFSQPISPEKIIIGQRKTEDTVTLTPTVANSKGYSVTINGTEFTFTSDVDATATEIVTGLISAVNGGAEPVTATGTTTLILNPDVATTYFSVTSSANLPITFTADQTFAEDIADIQVTNDTWYVLTSHSHVEADILAVAAAIEAMKKLYTYSTSDAAVLTSATTDVMSDLSGFNYERTFGLYDAEADTVFPECGWVGRVIPTDPGSATWAFKTITGVDQDNLTSTQSTYVRNKNGNTYETIGGVDITRYGKVASGEYIDVMIFCDWLESRMEERIYSRFVNLDKIPYTDAGVTIIETEIRSQLKEGIDAGGLAADPAHAVVVPKVSALSSATRATRELPAITFTATLAGAIHKTTIRGKVSA